MRLFFYFFAAIALIACDDNYSFDATASSGLHKTAAMDAEEADVGTPKPEDYTPPAKDSVSECTIDADCTDNDVCNGIEQCEDGQCVNGAPKVCPASTACAVSYCAPTKGCLKQLRDGFDCDDGDPETIGDYCDAGNCMPGESTVTEPPQSCDDGNPCTDDVWDGTACVSSFIDECQFMAVCRDDVAYPCKPTVFYSSQKEDGGWKAVSMSGDVDGEVIGNVADVCTSPYDLKLTATCWLQIEQEDGSVLQKACDGESEGVDLYAGPPDALVPIELVLSQPGTYASPWKPKTSLCP